MASEGAEEQSEQRRPTMFQMRHAAMKQLKAELAAHYSAPFHCWHAAGYHTAAMAPVVELNGLHGLSTGQTSGRPQKTGGQKSCRSWSSCHMMAACLKLHPQWGYLPSCHHMTDTVGSDCTGSVG